MLKRTLFGQMVTGPNGGVSSKRGAMFLVLFVFLAGYVASFWGIQPLGVMQEQLFTVLLALLGVVFGDNIVKSNKDIKIKQADHPNPVVNTTINKNEGADVTNVNIPKNE